MSNTDSPVGISRRTLVKSTALGGLALAAGGISLPFGADRWLPPSGTPSARRTSASSGAPVPSTAAAAAHCVCM